MPSGQPSAPPPIDAVALATGVAKLPRFGKVRYLESAESTNASALALFEDDAARGLSLVAEVQTAGHGRAGRAWLSPPGSGVLISTILPDDLPHETLPALGFWTGLCAADAVAQTCNVWPTLKWPNDLMIGPAKTAGILVEGRTLGAFTRAVTGVGINVNRPVKAEAELDGIAAWLSDAAGAPVDRTTLTIALVHAYEERYDDLLARPVEVIREWARRSAVAGRRLRVHSANGALLHEGTARSIADDGALLMDTQDGPVTVRLGDVSAL